MNSWFDKHIEEFIRPYLGYVPNRIKDNYFSDDQTRRIKNIWKAVKNKSRGKRLLLTGRDIYVFEVLARRENFNTLYLPNCSRDTANLIKINEINKYILFDNGFVGTIPTILGVDYLLISHFNNNPKIQLFPNMVQHRTFAFMFDRVPKYWTRAENVGGRIHQELSPPEEFIRAFHLTREIYTNSTLR